MNNPAFLVLKDWTSNKLFTNEPWNQLVTFPEYISHYVRCLKDFGYDAPVPLVANKLVHCFPDRNGERTIAEIRDWEQDTKLAPSFPWNRLVTITEGIPQDFVIGEFDEERRIVRYVDEDGKVFYGFAHRDFKRPIMSRGKKAPSLAYTVWQPNMVLPIPPPKTRNATLDLSKWQRFPLYDPQDEDYKNISPTSLPPKFCHLADRVVGKLVAIWADGKITKETLHKRYPSTFDTRGFVYVNRQPLGAAAKAVNPANKQVQYLVFHQRYILLGNERNRRDYLISDKWSNEAHPETYLTFSDEPMMDPVDPADEERDDDENTTKAQDEAWRQELEDAAGIMEDEDDNQNNDEDELQQEEETDDNQGGEGTTTREAQPVPQTPVSGGNESMREAIERIRTKTNAATATPKAQAQQRANTDPNPKSRPHPMNRSPTTHIKSQERFLAEIRKKPNQRETALINALITAEKERDDALKERDEALKHQNKPRNDNEHQTRKLVLDAIMGIKKMEEFALMNAAEIDSKLVQASSLLECAMRHNKQYEETTMTYATSFRDELSRLAAPLNDHELSQTIDAIKDTTILTNKWANRRIPTSE